MWSRGKGGDYIEALPITIKKQLNLMILKATVGYTYLSYTDCRTVCPRTTVNMVDVQEELSGAGLKPQIVSFNIDPDNDKPEDLIEYAAEYKVDLDSWDFLTGYDFDTIQNLSEKSFKSVLENGAADQVAHSYMFYLVDPKGVVVKKYDGMSSTELGILVEDLKTVL